MNLSDYITTIPDFPQKGIMFRDITTLLQNGEAFSYAVKKIAEYAKSKGATVIVGPEARGFMIGCPVATELKIGFVPVRKPGKLPRASISEEYSLEYGTNTLSIHADSLKKGDKVVIVDDLLATGGTVGALVQLTRKLGGNVKAAAFIIDLFDLGGADILKNKYQVESVSLLKFPGH